MKKRCGNCGESEPIGIIGEVAPGFSDVCWCFILHKSMRKEKKGGDCWKPKPRKRRLMEAIRHEN